MRSLRVAPLDIIVRRRSAQPQKSASPVELRHFTIMTFNVLMHSIRRHHFMVFIDPGIPP
jgi:mRNA deadenylase 3'-5' endonuclease subunit Ccr4